MKLLATIALGLLILSPISLARTPDGLPPANEGVCNELLDATPGLYGLCVSFCEAQDCVPDFTLENPFENCRAGSQKVLDNYEKRRGAGDPSMPCIQQASCPCWTDQELFSLRSVDQTSDSWSCFLNQDIIIPDVITLLDRSTWNILNNPTQGPEEYFTQVVSVADIDNTGNSFCSLVDRCVDGNCLGGQTGIVRFLPTDTTEHAACETEIADSAVPRLPTECVDFDALP